MPFIENVARGSAKERTVCTLQGVTQKGNAKRNALKYCRKRKNGLLTKHIRFLKAVMKKRTAGKNILILHDLVFVNRCAGESAKSNTPIETNCAVGHKKGVKWRRGTGDTQLRKSPAATLLRIFKLPCLCAGQLFSFAPPQKTADYFALLSKIFLSKQIRHHVN